MATKHAKITFNELLQINANDRKPEKYIIPQATFSYAQSTGAVLNVLRYKRAITGNMKYALLQTAPLGD